MLAPRFSLSEYLMNCWLYASKTTSTLPLCTPNIQYHGQDTLCQFCKCFVVAVHTLYQTHPINDTGCWSSDSFCRRHIFSQTPWQVRLCFFSVGIHLHLPVLMAVGPVGGPGHPSYLHLYSQLPVSSAFRTTFWPFIRDVLC